MLPAMVEPAVPLAPPRQARSKIAVRGLWMAFERRGNRAEAVHVLEDINLEVRDGELVCGQRVSEDSGSGIQLPPQLRPS